MGEHLRVPRDLSTLKPCCAIRFGTMRLLSAGVFATLTSCAARVGVPPAAPNQPAGAATAQNTKSFRCTDNVRCFAGQRCCPGFEPTCVPSGHGSCLEAL